MRDMGMTTMIGIHGLTIPELIAAPLLTRCGGDGFPCSDWDRCVRNELMNINEWLSLQPM